MFRSLNHIYAQVIDDALGHTLAAAGSLDGTGKSAGRHQDRPRRKPSASWWPSAPAPQASPRSSSTVAAGSTMAVSRRWLMPPVKPGWSSKKENQKVYASSN